MESETASDYNGYIFTTTDKRLLGLLPMFILVIIIVLRISWTLYKSFGQKTRNQQPRRGAVFNGSRSRPSLSSHEPTIYVSPSNLPPPPKYECLAPPSYEEVVGIHYPNYQAQQPIAQPIATALAQSTQPSTTAQDSGSDTRNNDTVVVTVNERPTVTNT